MLSPNTRSRAVAEVVIGAALLGLCALLLGFARSLAWDSTRLAESGDSLLAYTHFFWAAGLPLAWWLRRQIPEQFCRLLPLLGAAVALAIMAPEGRFACIIALGYVGAIALEPLLTRLEPRLAKPGLIPWALFALFVLVASASVLHRHNHFGSGAWDLGCFSHSSWLASRFEPLQSTILNDAGVHVLGDHFYPVILLLAPLHWLGLGAKGLLVAQILAVGAVAFPFHRFIARRTDSPLLRAALLAALLFSFAFQSSVYFDFHAQTLALWPLMEAIDRLDRGRYKSMLPWLALVWICKESMPLYVAAFGAYLVLFVPQARKMGLALGLGGLGGLLITVGWLQPQLLAGGPQGMIHAANYEAFGKSLPEAVFGMAKNPLRTLLIAVSPIEKRMALLTTFCGAGLIAWLKPRYLILALPTLVERFLSSKPQMWEMGYHYAAPLTLFVAVAAVDALPRLQSNEKLWAWRLEKPVLLAVMVLLLAGLTNGYAYRHHSNFLTWNHDYFLPKAEAQAARRMVEQVPKGVSVEAMNHVLAHLADRKDARFIRSQPQADYVAFSLAQDDWKPKRGNVSPKNYRKLLKRMMNGADYQLVFSQKLAVLFRRGIGDVKAVSPSPQLTKFLGR
jgi:uncharacterized membrane protein